MPGPARARVGPFLLDELLGRGGTADVWRARHESGAVVALKLLRAQLAGEASIVEAVKGEVEAVARLEHPSIALVLDFGFVSGDEASSSGGALARGAPWLALELASGHTLAALRATTWTALRDTLSVLLGALAHAHAHGFIHRDLKPANVLVCTASDARPGLKLTDFGLARARDADGRRAEGAVAGTPAYMSPEQFLLDDAALGPWSDLYALGCLAFTLVTGKPPFHGSGKALLRAHLQAERPPLPPLPDAPSALNAWVRRLLEVEPRARFSTAADARHALHALDDSQPPDPRVLPPGLVPKAGSLPPLSSSTPQVSSLDEEEPTEGWRLDGGLAAAPTRVRGAPLAADGAERTLPSTWRTALHDDDGATRGALLGAGLGLYGLREVPVSGREAERDALWRALVDVHREGRTKAVVLRGHAGTGKSRLASWLCRRAHEIGGVSSLRAEHEATLSSAEALARMVARHVGLPPGATIADGVEHVRRWAHYHAIEEADVPAIASLLPSHGPEAAALPPKDRHERLCRLLAAASRDRPVIVWLDDVQWGHDALRFVAHALDRGLPVLFLLTVRDTAAAGVAEEALAALEQRHDVATLPIGALAAPEHRALVGDLLHLAPELAARVAERTLGSPLFAVQLVGEWVQRGLLVLGRRGFEVRPGAVVRLPDALHEVWSSHVERLCATLPTGARTALEIAAVLGTEVLFVEWRAACALALPNPGFLDELTGAMVRARLAERRAGGGGWAFSHGALRESVERGARERDVLEQHHRVVAAALADVYGAEAAGVSERVGVHRFHARAYEAALEPLLLSSRERGARDEHLEVLRLLDLYDDAAHALGLPHDDERRAEALLLRARAQVESGAPLDLALRAAAEVHSRKHVAGWERHQPAAWLLRAYVAYKRGALDEAARDFRYARGWGRRVGDDGAELRALLGLGDVEYYAGERRSAGRRYREALPLADRRGDVRLTVRCLWSLGYVEMWAGRLARARRLFERQLELCHEEGDAIGVGRALASLAEVRRLSGELDEAERLMRDALVPFERSGAVRSVAVGRLNLLAVDVARQRFSPARQGILRLLPELTALDEPPFVAIANALLTACAIGMHDVEAAERHLRYVEDALRRRFFVEGDLAEALEQAGRQACALGERELGRRALRLAREQWLRVGREEHAAVLDAELEGPREEAHA